MPINAAEVVWDEPSIDPNEVVWDDERKRVGYVKAPGTGPLSIAKETVKNIPGAAKDLAVSAGKAVTSGVLGLEESVGTGVQMLGTAVKNRAFPSTSAMDKAGAKEPLGEAIAGYGKEASEFWKEKKKPFAQKEELQGNVIDKPGLMKSPEWWVYNIFETIPGMAASMVPGMAAGKYIKIGGEVLKLTPKLVNALARIGSAVTSGTIGGGLEGAQTFDKVKELGGTDEEATSAAIKMTAASGLLNALSFDTMMGKPTGGILSAIKHSLVSGGTEALTESAEEPTEALIMKQTLGDKIPEGYGDLLKGSAKSAATVAPTAFVTGTAGGVGGALSQQKEQPKIKQPLKTEIPGVGKIIGIDAKTKLPIIDTTGDDSNDSVTQTSQTTEKAILGKEQGVKGNVQEGEGLTEGEIAEEEINEDEITWDEPQGGIEPLRVKEEKLNVETVRQGQAYADMGGYDLDTLFIQNKLAEIINNKKITKKALIDYAKSKGLIEKSEYSKERIVDNIHKKLANERGYKNLKKPSMNADKGGYKGEEIGDFGPIFTQFKGKPNEAVKHLLKVKDGEAIGALFHPDIGDIDLVWGKEGSLEENYEDGFGLSKIARKHPEVIDNLQDIISQTSIKSRGKNRIRLESNEYKAVVRLNWNEKTKNWLLTAFKKLEPPLAGGSTGVSGNLGDTHPVSQGDSNKTIPQPPRPVKGKKKEPWQMTRSEYFSHTNDTAIDNTFPKNIADEIKKEPDLFKKHALIEYYLDESNLDRPQDLFFRIENKDEGIKDKSGADFTLVNINKPYQKLGIKWASYDKQGNVKFNGKLAFGFLVEAKRYIGGGSNDVIRIYKAEDILELGDEPGGGEGVEYILYKPKLVMEISADVVDNPKHRKIVKQAISEGKPVPFEVLKDYPDLQITEQKKGLSPPKNSDMGGYAQSDLPVWELPEMVGLAERINKGEFPTVTRFMDALGRFIHGKLGNKILLRADIAIGERIAELSVRPKKADEAFETFKEGVREKSGLPEDMLVFKKEYNRKTGKVDLIAYRKDPTLAAKVLTHEIFHLIDHLPDSTKRGNILGHIASLKKYLKTMIDALPTDSTKIITGKERLRLDREAAQFAKRKYPTDKQKQNELYKETYKKFLEREIEKRGLITRDEILAELKALTQKWKPFDEQADEGYTKYRYSNVELYADAGSVLLNNPQLLKEVAPKYYKSFLAYLGRKSEVKKVYDEILGRMKDKDKIIQHRIDLDYQAFKEGHEERQKMDERNKVEAEGVFDTLMTHLIDQYHASLKEIRKLEQGADKDIAQQARFDLEEMQYLDSEIENYIHDFDAKVTKAMKSSGIVLDDLGLYAKTKRIIRERGKLGIFNPRGETIESAREKMKGLVQRLGKKKFREVARLVSEFRKIREELIIPRIEESGKFAPELVELIKKNKDFINFSVIEHLKGKYGSGTTATIYKQYGTVKDIENPIVSTILQDISLLRAIAINESKLSMIEVLKATEAIEDAKMEYSKDVGGMVPIAPENKKLYDVFTVVRDGKAEHYYVSKAIVDTYKVSPFQATMAGRVWGYINAPLRDILVSKNPVWMSRNIVRDFRATIKNNQEVKLRPRDIFRLIRSYKEAVGEAYKDIFKGERSEDIAAMMQGKMLTPNRIYGAKEGNYENKIEELTSDVVAESESHGAFAKLRSIYNFLDKAGRLSEITTKITGYKYFKEYTDLSREEIGHRVRTRIGTPDYRRTGRLQWLTNNIFMFSNINKESMRSAYESFKEDPTGYMWKTTATNIFPLLILLGAGAAGSESVRKILQSLTGYDLSTKTIIPTPFEVGGKPVAIGIPEDYEGQFFRSLIYRILAGGNEDLGKKGLLNLVLQQSPYKMHPLIKIGSKLYNYYINGLNSVDEFRGQTIIPEQEFKAGGWAAGKYLLRYTLNTIGGSTFYKIDFADVEKDVSTVEKLKKTFPFNMLGNFVIISDYGITEKAESIKEKVQAESAKRSLSIRDRIIEHINNSDDLANKKNVFGLYKELVKEGAIDRKETEFGNFFNKYKRYESRRLDDRRIDAVEYATSNKEKEVLLGEYQKELKPEDFKVLLNQLKIERSINPRIYLKYKK